MENEMMHNQMMSRLHEKAAMGEGHLNEDHDDIMAMLRRRVATGEGDECGGWAKGQELTKAQYMESMKKRAKTAGKRYTKKQLEELWKKLRAKRRAENKPVKVAPVKRVPVKKGKKGLSKWQQFIKDNAGRGLTLKEMADLYDYNRPINDPRKLEGPARTRGIAKKANEAINVLEKAIEVLGEMKDAEGNVPREIIDASNTLKTISTQYKRTGPRSHLPLANWQQKQIALLEIAKIKHPENTTLIDASIQDILGQGEGDLLYDLY